MRIPCIEKIITEFNAAEGIYPESMMICDAMRGAFDVLFLWGNGFDRKEQYHQVFHEKLMYKLNLYQLASDMKPARGAK